MRDTDQGSKPPVDSLKDVRGKLKPAATKAHVGAAGADRWFSRSGLKRRISRNGFFSPDQSTGRDAMDTGDTQEQESSLVERAAWTLCIAALLLAGGVGYLHLARPSASAPQSPAPAGLYLYGLAAWQAATKMSYRVPGGGLDMSWRSCAIETTLPPIKMETARRYVPDPLAEPVEDTLAELALNCNTDGPSSPECLSAAQSNMYEGGIDVLTSEDLLECIRAAGLDQPNTETPTEKGSYSGLDALALDCESDPDSCAAAAAVNNYEGGPSETYEDSFEAYNSWLTRGRRGHGAASQAQMHLELDTDCSRGSDAAGEARCTLIRRVNKYEDKERLIYRRRVAEEAGPEYISVSDLDLDCTDVAWDVQMECERSRAVNRYEQLRFSAGNNLGADTAYLSTGRTPGYDAAAMDSAEALAAAPVPGEGAAEQEASRPWQSTGRTAGYDVAAVDWRADTAGGEGEVDALVPAAGGAEAEAVLEGFQYPRAAELDVPAAGGGQNMQPCQEDQGCSGSRAAETAAHQERFYYKNPCNNPTNRRHYKNLANHPGSKLYYKNPLNMPAWLAAQQLLGSSISSPRAAPTSPQASGAAKVAFTLVAMLLGAGVFIWHQRRSSRLSGPEDAFPVPELPTVLLKRKDSVETQDVMDAGASQDSSGRHLLAPKQLGPHHDGADVVPEGIDSPRRAATPGPGMGTPRTLSRIGGPGTKDSAGDDA